VSVIAHTRCLAHENIEVEDVAAALISFESGAVGTLLASTAAYPGLPVRLAVHGAGGTAVMENDELAVFKSATATAPEAASLDEQNVPEGWSPVDVAHQRQYIDVLDAIAAGRRPSITTREGRRALQTVLAVYESARTGKPASIED
jgi:UDP-N-acetyl-2-amino-2-deoxyglucuronate dehydrogenase